MFKVTPNPPASIDAAIIDPQAIERALAHYDLPEGGTSKRSSSTTKRRSAPDAQHREEALVNASSILESAAATAYEHADNLTGVNRKLAMGVVHLIELALGLVDSVIEDEPARVAS
ncbi:DUF6124 family protein [Pseudomonas gingeri]|uniref:DUF6124 family protein n=1 Tax=Pseudomonas gingeri TaxID=117681 RepID=UPI0015A0CCD8|nr:hypothetical protein [Pseudomonas gingeri]NWD09083.1 hypothetical protein [Pseudomonas gingeri]NWE36865.1 hypothetical protein [Pseudomonas gingeri]NWE59232.1 hypothetical protein [Pseudomonas gingeri]NWF05688.1 hypothetical protein [Pseudomonas gingeri]